MKFWQKRKDKLFPSKTKQIYKNIKFMEGYKMEYIYSAMLLHKAGKEITENAVKAVLTAAGVSVDAARVKALVAALQGVDITEAIKKAAVAAPVAAVSTAAPEEKKKEEKKESKEDEKKAEESAAAGLGALFG